MTKAEWRFEGIEDDKAAISVNVGEVGQPEWHRFLMTLSDIDSNIATFGSDPAFINGKELLTAGY